MTKTCDNSHKTAISRKKLSKPMQLIMAHLYRYGDSILDYGCGRGDDVRNLAARRIVIDGYDPTWAPVVAPYRRDIVSMIYVLNVIEDTFERIHALNSAWAHTDRVLVVAIRPCKMYGGVLRGKTRHSSTGTYQYFFSQNELYDLINRALGNDIMIRELAPGIVYIERTYEN